LGLKGALNGGNAGAWMRSATGRHERRFDVYGR